MGRYYDLPENRALLHRLFCRADVIESDDPIDDGYQLALFDERQKFLEILTSAAVRTDDAGLANPHITQIGRDVETSCRTAHENSSTRGNRPQGGRPCLGADGVDDDVSSLLAS